MTKDEALKLALEALEEFGEHHDVCPRYPTYAEPENYPPCNCGFEKAITAIREALAQTEQEIDWKDQYEKQKRRAEMWIAKYEADIGPLEWAGPAKAQPEQEPVAYASDIEFDEETAIIPAEKKGSLGTAGLNIPLYIAPQSKVLGDAYMAGFNMKQKAAEILPPQRKPLTDEQWQVIADTLDCLITRKQKDAIEAVIGIKK